MHMRGGCQVEANPLLLCSMPLHACERAAAPGPADISLPCAPNPRRSMCLTLVSMLRRQDGGQGLIRFVNIASMNYDPDQNEGRWQEAG